MAVLRADGREHTLSAQTVVGRLERADLVIDSDYVSGMHALVQWQRDGWLVKDLGSHNGTALNGERLSAGEVRKLAPNDKLDFGDQTERWVLADDSAPEPMAIDPAGKRVVGGNGVLALPDPAVSTVVVWARSEGSWRLDATDGERVVHDGDSILVDGVRWTLALPLIAEPTHNAEGVRAPTSLKSSDLEVVAGQGERVHVLARDANGRECLLDVGAAGPLVARLAQAHGGDGDGWIDRETVLDSLRIRGSHMNVLAHRLRQQFARAGFRDAARIIQRRGGDIRLGGRQVVYTEQSA